MKAAIIPSISRWIFLIILISLFSGFSGTQAQPREQTPALLSIDASHTAPPPETGYLQMGGSNACKSPEGHVLTVNSLYLMLDNKPWLPVMGEFHFSRYPEKYWEEEILKMKAGGIQIISTYIFWIHQEEVEGQFIWSGQRNLRRFVELCGKHGLYVYPRIGPWAHGEVRNGGFPDWLLAKCRTRINDPIYLSYVSKYYNEIGKQLKGLLWKDGGPVIGIQIENEYSNRDTNGGSTHISKLKSIAIKANLDVPVYTVTGWDNAVIPPHIVIPVFGGYPDEPWSGSIQELAPDPEGVYQFHASTPTGTAGILQGLPTAPENIQLSHYPKFTAELGGGMQETYHRRVVVSGDDIASMALTAIGSGVNLLGYYMFQGGSNPKGKLTTLQESQATGYPNDVPVISYDFQAPLREFGRMNESFRKLKIIHQFISDFGTGLASMPSVMPVVVPKGQRDTSTLRIAARANGNAGFLFFNNYLRNYPLPVQKGIRITIKLKSETVTLPLKPVDIPSQSYFFWPMNMDLNGALLKYATAQPLTKINCGDTIFYFFISLPGISSEFAFVDSTMKFFHSNSGFVQQIEGVVYISGIQPSSKTAIDFKTQTGKQVKIILLSQQQAYNSWKLTINRINQLLITQADVFEDKNVIHLRSTGPKAFTFSIFPTVDKKFISTLPIQKAGMDGVFEKYTARVNVKVVPLRYKEIIKPGIVSPVKMGKVIDWRNCAVAEPPSDSDFARAGTWQINVPKFKLKGLSDIFLDIDYSGDICRLYSGTRLLDDNFFNGTMWQVGLKRFMPEIFSTGSELKIFPLRNDAPVYIPKLLRPDFKGASQLANINSIKAVPEYELNLTFK
jgi:hypothetical protein